MQTFVRDGKKLVERVMLDIPRVDILVIGAHNDDEMFPAGYLLNRIKEGMNVGVVIATDGTGSNYQGKTGEALMKYRTAESKRAVTRMPRGEFLISYQHPSSMLKSDEGIQKFTCELSDVVTRSKPKVILVQSPVENHYTHLKATEAAIEAIRKTKYQPTALLGYEVWTPLLPLIGTGFVQTWTFSEATAARKMKLQSEYHSQNSANPYPEATLGLNLFNKVMADAHSASGIGYSELFLDMKPLLFPNRFNQVTIEEYGAGLGIMAQYLRFHPGVKLKDKEASERLLFACCQKYFGHQELNDIVLDK